MENTKTWYHDNLTKNDIIESKVIYCRNSEERQRVMGLIIGWRLGGYAVNEDSVRCILTELHERKDIAR